ncbi:MAG: hypothetical protein AAGA50_29075 [Pseudomonadota bacterium]
MSSYLALTVAAVAGHLVVLSIAIAFPISLAPWIVLQLALMPVAAGAAWFFPGWLSVVSFSRSLHFGNIRFGSHGEHDMALDKEASGMPSKEAEMRLRSEIRELTKLEQE